MMRVIPFSPSKCLLLRGILRLDGHLLFFLLFFFSSSLAADMTSFDFPDFKNYTGIRFEGNAYSTNGTGAIGLKVADNKTSVGLAYYYQPIHLWNATTREMADFATNFTFGVSSIRGTNTGGGVAFFLSENPTIPASGDGDLLGLLNVSARKNLEGMRFVAVEFDSFSNNWEPRDNSCCHVGIDINSLDSVAYESLSGDSFLPGPQGKAQVAYNSGPKILSVSLDYNRKVYELSHVVDLRNELPEWVHVGFSLASDQFDNDPKNITSWSFRSSNLYASNSSSTKKKTVILVTAIVVPLLILLSVGILFLFLRKYNRAKCKDEAAQEIGNGHRMEDPPLRTVEHDYRNASFNEEFEDGGPQRIPFKHLVAATDNFHQSKRLGKGGFGAVYRGFLESLNQEVAVKRIEEYSEHGQKEFAAEVKTISRIRHRNLVKLIGFCQEGRELLLVYEFMPNGSLDVHLFGNREKVLSWPTRRNIALGVASALHYLHEELESCVVHRDIKPNNILLDSQLNAKVADFGLARTADHGSALQSTMMAGTMGYMAPECFITGKASKESDVYSYGIVALELVSGRRAMDRRERGRETLIHWIWELHGKGVMIDAVDRKLGTRTTFDEHEAERLMRVGLWCAHPDALSRPSFRQVISALNFEIAVPDMNIIPPGIALLPHALVSGVSSGTISANDMNINPPGIALLTHALVSGVSSGTISAHGNSSQTTTSTASSG